MRAGPVGSIVIGMNDIDRRTFLRALGGAASALVLAPLATSCGGAACDAPGADTASTSGAEATEPASPMEIPRERPADWDPVAFNRTRANAGAVPASYLDAINAADGAMNALGKHLPFVPTLPPGTVPAGMIAIMWGDPTKGHARHPNAVRDASNEMHGHWYDWIEIRKAVDGPAVAQRSEYPEWPAPASGRFAVLGGGDITDDAGKNTVYLAALPSDVRPGDTVRVFARCLTHGEYVDFLTVPS